MCVGYCFTIIPRQVKAFFDSKTDTIGTGLKTVSETLATIKTNIEKKGKFGSEIEKWIKQQFEDSL